MTRSSIQTCIRGFAGVAAALVAASGIAQPVGTVKVTAGDVLIQRDGKVMPAVIGFPVWRADRVVTGKDGSVGLVFADNAMLSAGPNTELVVEHFNFNPATAAGNFDLSLRKGTLSAISGKLVVANPGAMRVRTPTAVLAVRGTEFVVKVDEPRE